MNQSTVRKEGKKWVDKDIITEEQLNQILSTYEKEDKSYLLILFAVLLLSIGMLLFIFSDWAQVPNLIRVGIMIGTMIIFYGTGHHFFHQHGKHTSVQSRRQVIYGVSFLLLGYIFFGATLLLLLNMYNVTIIHSWPFVLWSIIGLFLYMMYKHPLLFVLGLGVAVSGQIYSGTALSSFSVLLFAIFFIGYFYYAYRQNRLLFSYLFSIGLAVQFIVFMTIHTEAYYWYLLYILLMYGLGEIVRKTTLQQALLTTSIVAVFIFKIYESFAIQESSFLKDIDYQSWFFILIGFVLVAVALSKWLHHKRIDWVDLILFIPLFYLPHAYIFIILSMFIFSVYWLVIGFQRRLENRILIGIITFMMSIFTVYIQYAWDTLNKSLFFLIGGLLLFFLSFVLERKRRREEKQ